MKTRLIGTIALLGLLAGCSGVRESRLNPFNWFGASRASQQSTTAAEVSDPRVLVARLVSLRIDRLPGGAILRAVGLPERQGYFEAVLKPQNDEKPVKGVLTYEFRLMPPETATPAGTPRSREVLVGRFVSDQALAGVRVIRVLARDNRRSLRR